MKNEKEGNTKWNGKKTTTESNTQRAKKKNE